MAYAWDIVAFVRNHFMNQCRESEEKEGSEEKSEAGVGKSVFIKLYSVVEQSAWLQKHYHKEWQ